MFIVIDIVDEYVHVAETFEEAFLNAINHCVIEGLLVVGFNNGINYKDPDDGLIKTIIIRKL